MELEGAIQPKEAHQRDITFMCIYFYFYADWRSVSICVPMRDMTFVLALCCPVYLIGRGSVADEPCHSGRTGGREELFTAFLAFPPSIPADSSAKQTIEREIKS